MKGFSVSVAIPDNFTDSTNKSSNEFYGFKLGARLKAETAKIVYGGGSLDKVGVKGAVKLAFNEMKNNYMDIKHITVKKQDDDGVESSIDFINNRLKDTIKVIYIDRANEKDYCDAMLFGYKNNFDVIKSLFNVE
ncbi:hypothetical protein [Apilactobacillus micheneri]|uniref:Uncharacterized protein n=1 Tax=Apilactobacillus micheneri TaxID=1899430 RepID=A0A9Q8IM31_9LACO|nr:hypothetical protein [Apilactobacillus micheneri]TPR39978.1 hypothetical protein DY121_03855 [Apilactobacillus micheneri]TPR44180.1 hypothetical protein DY130_03850 [Apilactobacillus micheneri]TPR45804.1 hypothetical protein DY128_03850 [Apilactobacillus micheneri]TPR50548.1 hypothetical protein DY037_00965 [Apilactobacillus micheneri]TPR51566.1 hypothetical protein DY126_03910 [Apilactobacillus micheneri]